MLGPIEHWKRRTSEAVLRELDRSVTDYRVVSARPGRGSAATVTLARDGGERSFPERLEVVCVEPLPSYGERFHLVATLLTTRELRVLSEFRAALEAAQEPA